MVLGMALHEKLNGVLCHGSMGSPDDHHKDLVPKAFLQWERAATKMAVDLVQLTIPGLEPEGDK